MIDFMTLVDAQVKQGGTELTEIAYWAEMLRDSGVSLFIDGPGDSGKSLAVNQIAAELEMTVMPTGDMYRGITWYLLNMNVDINMLSDEQLTELIGTFTVRFEKGDTGNRVWVGDGGANLATEVDVANYIRRPEIDKNVSLVSQRQPVRDVLGKAQIKFVDDAEGPVIGDGRDMYKLFGGRENAVMIYLYANEETLISREIQREAKKGSFISEEVAAARILGRNEADIMRRHNPLLTTQEAELYGIYDAVIDTTGKKPYEVVLEILATMGARLPKQDQSVRS